MNRKELVEKWSSILNHDSLPPIKDYYRKECVAQLLENQQNEMRKGSEALFETAAAPVNSGAGNIGALGGGSYGNVGGVNAYDPVLISLVRRSMPQLIAYDICGVQPMTQPVGLIFAMKTRYKNQSGDEALFNEADTTWSGREARAPGDKGLTSLVGATGGASGATGADLGATGQDQQSALAHATSDWTSSITRGTGMITQDAEKLGSDSSTHPFNEMAFSIEKTSVTARTRALKAEYSVELAQDLKAVHGLDAEGELSNILSGEILTEINREVVRTIYSCAKPGAQVGTANAGVFDLDIDSNGRWSVEKFKGMMFQIEREANAIAQQTRRGRGNFIMCSSDVASALSMAGVLDYTPALAQNAAMNIDEASTTFAGILNGKYKVFIDPYAANQAGYQFFVVGYKGASAFDAGLFYCPYVPLQLVRAVDPNTFQPKIGFKTRYGMVANPFVDLDDLDNNNTNGDGGMLPNKNYYYRRVLVKNLM